MFACERDLMFSAVQAAAFFERVANHSATKRAALYTSPRSRTAVVQRRLAERRPARAAVAAGSNLDPLHAKSVRKLGNISLMIVRSAHPSHADLRAARRNSGVFNELVKLFQKKIKKSTCWSPTQTTHRDGRTPPSQQSWQETHRQGPSTPVELRDCMSHISPICIYILIYDGAPFSKSPFLH